MRRSLAPLVPHARRFRAPWPRPVLPAARRAGGGKRTWPDRRASRPRHPGWRHGFPPFRDSHLRAASRARLIGFVLVVLTRDSAGEIEHVEFHRRMTQQMGEITETLGVFQAKGFAAVADGPVLALFAEDAFFCSRGTGDRRRDANVSRWDRALRISCGMWIRSEGVRRKNSGEPRLQTILASAHFLAHTSFRAVAQSGTPALCDDFSRLQQ